MKISIWKLIWMLLRASWYVQGSTVGSKVDCSFTFPQGDKWWTVIVKEGDKYEKSEE